MGVKMCCSSMMATTPKNTTSSETKGIASRKACAISCSSHSPFRVVTKIAIPSLQDPRQRSVRFGFEGTECASGAAAEDGPDETDLRDVGAQAHDEHRGGKALHQELRLLLRMNLAVLVLQEVSQHGAHVLGHLPAVAPLADHLKHGAGRYAGGPDEDGEVQETVRDVGSENCKVFVADPS